MFEICTIFIYCSKIADKEVFEPQLNIRLLRAKSTLHILLQKTLNTMATFV